MAENWRISATVWPSDQAQLMKATEVLTRAAAGLAMDGVEVMLMIGPHEEDD